MTVAKVVSVLAVVAGTMAVAAPAYATPNPAKPPASSGGVATACDAVFTHNPANAQSLQGQEHFGAVGGVFCGL